MAASLPNFLTMRLKQIPTPLFAVLFFLAFCLTSCKPDGKAPATLTLAVNSGVEGDALKQAARDYETQTGVHINIAEFPYANLFEKELLDLNSHTGAYDLIMLDDPWFPKFSENNLLSDLGSLMQARGMPGPDPDFLTASLALCHNPYESGGLYALPYVGNSQLFFFRKDLFEKHN